MVRGNEKGKAFFIEILTWRDAGIPDNAPAPIQEIWTAMHKLVEPRDGRPGIDFVEVFDSSMENGSTLSSQP